MHTRANWHFDGKWVEYIELYIQTLGNSMSDHTGEIIILVRSCRDSLTFVLNKKYPAHFRPIGSSYLTQKVKKKGTGKAYNHIGTYGLIILMRDSMLPYESQYFKFFFGHQLTLTSRESILIMNLSFY